MLNYIIQVVLFQILFLVIYDFFLSKETFFNKNRWYLLSTPILSFVLPLVKIPTFQKAVPQSYVLSVPEIVFYPEQVIAQTSWYQSLNYIDILFAIGVIIFSVVFIAKLWQIIDLISSYKRVKKQNYTLVLIPKEAKAFSFFNYIFIGKEIPENQKEEIIAHELVHSKQKHSLDLLFFEILKIVMWFNPMVYIYQKRITLVHEYISDEVATKSLPKENYINQLLSNFFQVENIAFINQFTKQSLIKKRILMMTKSKSKKTNQLKYLVLIPVLIAMLFYSSCSENELNKDLGSEKELRTMYFNNKGKQSEYVRKTETYLDTYVGIGDEYRLPKGKEFNAEDLTVGEKMEFQKMKFALDSSLNARGTNTKIDLRIFAYKKNRKVIVMEVDYSQMKRRTALQKLYKSNSVNFMSIETAATFPGCEVGDKDCFNKKIQKHFVRNFDKDLPKSLGLQKGIKRIFIGFKVDTKGDVIDVEARGPHTKIEEEVIRVMHNLPKMKPGETKGEKITVSYNFPFTVIVD
ncbi:M56 family metallopeptidase [uncultured Polaribacter sp.]|uniref:M56 family metallopeptidase n=1 Tax=uncultured Polaribacter sp. TaxID=174711 RepID=UPI00261F89B4|nr:M56 family metallopeptidase [uncultured Polaribacter sp.]